MKKSTTTTLGPVDGRSLREKPDVVDSVVSTRTTIVLETLKETGKLPLDS